MRKDSILLVTTDASLPRWRSLRYKLNTIRKELNTIEGADFIIKVHSCPKMVPQVVDGRITHRWMDELVRTIGGEFAHVALHMSNRQAKKWKIEPGLRGASQIDRDDVHEFYFWADEDSRRLKLNQFIQTFLHEFRHGFMRGCGLPDDTHARHADRTLYGDFKGLRLAQFKPERLTR